MAERRIPIAIIGAGTVGAELIAVIERRRNECARRHGIVLDVVAIGVRDPQRHKSDYASLMTANLDSLLDAPDIEIVVELIGDEDSAARIIERALNSGKDVVSANRRVLSRKGAALLDIAHQSGSQLRFEASVGGGVPIVSALQGGLVGSRIDGLRAIVSGTSNFIASYMKRQRSGFDAALAAARARGLTPFDSRRDVDGRDASEKLAILAALAFDTDAAPESIAREGMDSIDLEDIDAATRFGYVLRHLAVAYRRPEGLELRVNPAWVPGGTFLATVEDDFNAFLVEGTASQELVFIGRGSGAGPAAGAVYADIVECALRRNAPQGRAAWTWGGAGLGRVAEENFRTGFYLRFPVLNAPGAIGKITTTLGDHAVNIDSLSAREDSQRADLGIVEILSHNARQGDVDAALRQVEAQGVLRAPYRKLRIEEWRPVSGYF